MAAVHPILAILRKDLLAELRSRDTLAPMFVFALIAVLMFSFSFDLRTLGPVTQLPGVLWVTLTFTGMLGLGRSFVREKDQGCLDGLLLCPTDRVVIYIGKALANLAFITAMEAMVLPLSFALFNVRFPLSLAPVVVLGTFGFSAVGTLFSAVSVNARAREVLLPVLVLPLLIPALIAAVKLTAGILDGLAWSEMRHWLDLLIAFDAIYAALACMLFGAVFAE